MIVTTDVKPKGISKDGEPVWELAIAEYSDRINAIESERSRLALALALYVKACRRACIDPWKYKT